jgi:hypothetical protein
MKILIIGKDQSGKDHIAEIFHKNHGLAFKSASLVAAKTAIFPSLRHTYHDFMHCFNDRRNWRSLWKELIRFHNESDKLRLVRDVLAVSDMYVGLRSLEEFEAADKEWLFDFVVYVKGGLYSPEMEIPKYLSFIFIDNTEKPENIEQIVASAFNDMVALMNIREYS